MEVLHIQKKGQKLNILEKFYIYNLTKKALQINAVDTETYNYIFNTLIKTYSYI
jgi:hypothetical protein